MKRLLLVIACLVLGGCAAGQASATTTTPPPTVLVTPETDPDVMDALARLTCDQYESTVWTSGVIPKTGQVEVTFTCTLP